MFGKLMVMLLASVVLAGCAPQIHTEYDEKADFSNYKTFTWAPPVIKKVENPILDSELLTERVYKAVKEELTRRGYTEVEKDADFNITYHTASKEKLRSSPFSIGIGYGHYYGRWGHSVIFDGPDMRSEEEGVLILDIMTNNKLVWRGWDTSLVSQKNYSQKAINQAVEKILAKFPPGKA